MNKIKGEKMKIKKIKLKKEQKKIAGIAIAAILLLAGIYGVYQYSKTEYSMKTPASVAARVTFADGSTQSFDSRTMVPGAIYNPGTNQPITSIQMPLRLSPVVQLSTGGTISYPSSLPAGYILKSNEPSAILAIALIGSGLSMGGFKVYTVPSVVLLPNPYDSSQNVIYTATILASEIDSATQSLPDGALFDVQWQGASLMSLYATLHKPDGTESSAYITNAPVIKVTVKKVVGTAGTATYTLQSVTVTGGSGFS